MAWEYTPLIIPLIACALAAVGAIVLLLRRKGAVGVRPFTLLMGAILVWVLCYIIELCAPTLESKLLWSNIKFTGVVAVPVLWFVFAARYASWGRRPTRLQVDLLVLLPLVTLALLWTSPDTNSCAASPPW